jgi:voltage-gated potassium channel Kch
MQQSDFPLIKIMNMEFICSEIVRSVAGLFGMVLAIPMLLSTWSTQFGLETPLLNIIGNISGSAYFALIAVTILIFIFTTRSVNGEIISAALVVYLLLGVLWGFGYNLIDTIHPGSFNIPDHFTRSEGSSYMYYSFITLTTVGYGDITPVSGMARSLSMLEGIIGQSYMAVLVARLVGMQVAISMSKTSRK